MTKIGFFFILWILLGCEKPNPTPEMGDAIYLDLGARADNTQKAAEAEKKKLEGLKKELNEAKPYTGELKSAQKRYFESEKKLQQLLQEKYFYTLRARSRKELVRNTYVKQYPEKKVWDASEDAKSYEEFQRISTTPLTWDSKRRIANYEKETGLGGPKLDAPPAAGTKKESKGH